MGRQDTNDEHGAAEKGHPVALTGLTPKSPSSARPRQGDCPSGSMRLSGTDKNLPSAETGGIRVVFQGTRLMGT